MPRQSKTYSRIMGSRSRERRRRKSFNVNQYRTNKMDNLYNSHFNPLLSRKAGNNAMRKINLFHLQQGKLSKTKNAILYRNGQPRTPKHKSPNRNKSRKVSL